MTTFKNTFTETELAALPPAPRWLEDQLSDLERRMAEAPPPPPVPVISAAQLAKQLRGAHLTETVYVRTKAGRVQGYGRPIKVPATQCRKDAGELVRLAEVISRALERKQHDRVKRLTAQAVTISRRYSAEIVEMWGSHNIALAIRVHSYRLGEDDSWNGRKMWALAFIRPA